LARRDLRYLYPSLALFSLAIGWVIAELRCSARRHRDRARQLRVLESAGWYHKDFAAFTPAGARKYLEEARRSAADSIA